MKTIMRRQEVLDATGLCYTSIYNKEKAGEFPARRQLSTRSVGWIRQEVEDWINNLVAGIRPVVRA
jgi:prophage regulatory protein